MIVHNGYMVFTMMEKEVHLISDETAYGRNTVVEINDSCYYMGDAPPNLITAMFAWQKFNNRDLTEKEIYKIMVENHIIS